MEKPNYDLTILGAGLAGFTLARELLQARPDARILILEKNRFPMEEKAHKVGESTVEIGAWYLHKVGLTEHMKEHHLPKYGLRMFFNRPNHTSLADGLEFGLTDIFPNTSVQIDRGKLENFLADDCTNLGVTLHQGVRIQDLDVKPDREPHSVSYRHEDALRTITTRWIVDASGRRALLKSKLNLSEGIEHHINSAWFRINARMKPDDWCRYQRHDGLNETRWLSTCHLLGEGYWIWIIPLPDDVTSFGLVADPTVHPLNTYNSFDKMLTWLRKHEPVMAAQIEAHRDDLMDFKALKRLGRNSRQMFSADRWAMTGEAGFFLDPFYSPGTDFIGMNNGFITAMIARDLRGRPIGGQTQIYENMFRAYFNYTLTVYQNQYQVFGNGGVMSLKVIWDYVVYWSFTAFVTMQGRLTDVSTMAEINEDALRIGQLHNHLQAFFRDLHKVWNPELRNVFVNQSEIALLRRLNTGLTAELDAGGFIETLTENLEVMEDLSQEIIRPFAECYPELAFYRDNDAQKQTHYLDDLWPLLGISIAPSLV